MGVQHGMCTDVSLEPRIIEPERPKSFPGEFDQEIVSEALVTPQERTELSRQGEGHHEVVHGKEFPALTLQPPLAFLVLAMRTAAVAAGVRVNLE